MMKVIDDAFSYKTVNAIETHFVDKNIEQILLSHNYDEDKAIIDLGAPYSIISEENVDGLIKSLSKFQKMNIRRRKVNQTFKFGESTFC